jgi:hypothetical protein
MNLDRPHLRWLSREEDGYTVLAHVATGDLATAALQNSLLDDLAIVKTPIADDGVLVDDTESDISIAANVLTVNLATARHFKFSLNANITTMTLQNIPTTGKAAWFVLKVVADGSARTWTWFASTVKWGSAVPAVPTTTNNHWDMFLFISYDGGTTWTGSVIDQNYS